MPKEDFVGEDAYLNRIPAIRNTERLELSLSPVTFLVGENGAGKSTLLEAIAVAAGFNPEGGSINLRFSTADTHSGLGRSLRLVREPRRPKDGFFLRAESFYNVATSLDEAYRGEALKPYGGISLHRQSHGEGFLSLVLHRLRGHGLYLFDEPEAALSPTRQLSLLSAIHGLVGRDSQLIIATHSPLLMAYPGACIYLLSQEGIGRVEYRDTEHYQVTREFLLNPERMLNILLED